MLVDVVGRWYGGRSLRQRPDIWQSSPSVILIFSPAAGAAEDEPAKESVVVQATPGAGFEVVEVQLVLLVHRLAELSSAL